MQPIPTWPLDKAELSDFCRRWKIQELALFGSVLRNDFGPESDVDFLVSFTEHAQWTLFDVAQMEEELTNIVGRPVELVSKRAIEQSPNWKRKSRILSSAQPYFSLPTSSVTSHELA